MSLPALVQTMENDSHVSAPGPGTLSFGLYAFGLSIALFREVFEMWWLMSPQQD